MKHILLLTIGCLTANIVLAQDIQQLPSDKAVQNGYLPNGTSYYIVSNRQMKNMADFAVVQKTGTLTVPGTDGSSMVSVGHKLLDTRPHPSSPAVKDYFMSVGTVPGKNGFIEVSDNATVFKFRNVNLAQGKEVLDSALWMMMEMVRQAGQNADTLISRWYAPSDQAIIVSGDVSHDKVLEKLRMLSYMTPASVSLPRKGYVWKEQKNAEVRTSVEDRRHLAFVSASWRLQRTPKEYMNTVQPVIFGRYMTELGNVVEERIGERLKASDIPVAFIEADYLDSVESFDDELFTVKVATAPHHWSDALSSIASVMSSLDAGEVDVPELRRAEAGFFDELDKERHMRISNKEYMDRCIAAFICNAPLVSEEDKSAFHYSRRLEDEMELELFRSIAAASVDPDRNLIVECRVAGDTLCADEIREVFSKAWKVPVSGSDAEMSVPSLYGIQEKVRVRSVKKEHVSGGTIWTLSNGLKVMFRNMPSDGRVYYSLSLNGGYGSIQDLAAGEGAYLSDYLEMCRIGGVKAKVFKDIIRRQGMTMDMRVDLSRMSIAGNVPKDRTDLLLKVLLTVLNDSEIDREEFGYYLKNEALRMENRKGSVQERIAAIDEIICPGYRYSSVKRSGALTDGFVDKADGYMDRQAAKVNDGVLILVGEIDESRLKEALALYAGGFGTSESVFSRPVVNYQPISGKLLYSFDGDENSADVVMSAPLAYSADNHYASGLAAMVLRKGIIRKIAGKGVSLRFMHECLRYPQERFNVMLSVSGGSADVAVLVRTVLDDAGSWDISDAELASYKDLFKQQMSVRREDPEYWIEAIAMRYLDGKDFTTGCDAKIDAVTEDRILKILSSLNDGLRVEYIINGK